MVDYLDESLSYEEIGIGVLNESNLHYQIKKWYQQDGDRFEVRIDGKVIDLVRGEHLIEIQTGNFSALKSKLSKLIDHYSITVVYPVAIEKWISMTNEYGELIYRRKSPAKGDFWSIFKELASICEYISNPNLSIEIIYIKIEELRKQDGKGSWRRRGISIVNRSLMEVIYKDRLGSLNDYRKLFPEGLNHEFTNRDLAEILGIRVEKARLVTYCMKKSNVINEIGKRGRELLYKVVES